LAPVLGCSSVDLTNILEEGAASIFGVEDSSVLKIWAACYFKMSVKVHKTTQHHIPADSNLAVTAVETSGFTVHTPYLAKIFLDSILSCMLISVKWSLSVRFPN
jgi:hypothetical protein